MAEEKAREEQDAIAEPVYDPDAIDEITAEYAEEGIAIPDDIIRQGLMLKQHEEEPEEESEEAVSEEPEAAKAEEDIDIPPLDLDVGPRDVKPEKVTDLDPEEVVRLKMFKEAIVSNPKLYELFQKVLRGEEITQEDKVAAGVPRLEVPPRPADFDPMEALDPTTESGKWYQQYVMAATMQALSPVFEKVTKEVQDVKRTIEEERRRQEELMRKQELERGLREFLSKHPEVRPHLKEFIEFVHNPGQLTWEDAWELFRRRTPVSAKEAAAASQELRKKVKPAPSVSELGGGEKVESKPKKPGDILEQMLASRTSLYEY